jgi:pyruvate dehydrogenase E2 component (dihydrolipoamide acetyltransferase)
VARELTMPKLSDSMADAVIIRWLKSPGDAFQRGEGLIEVETDKATVVYEAETAGTLASILVPEGGTAAVGQAIATLGNGEGPAPAERPPAPVEEEPRSAQPAPEPARSDAGDGAGARRPNATPVARRTAVELGVSLHDVAGTGPGGRITAEDVTRAAEQGGAPAPTPSAVAGGKGDVTTLQLTPTQATIARRMAESATTIPVFTVSMDIDVSEIVAWRRDARAERDDVPSLNDFVVKAVAKALGEFPRFNASWVDGKVECYSRINVGVAVATEDALLVPVVFDADRKSLAEIAADTSRLADAARRRAVELTDLQGGTFTVSNLGMFGVGSFTAIIDSPQVAILAVGGARRTPVEDGPDRVGFRDVMTVNLSCDHRVVYGADGATFLARLRELLERPLGLAL